MVVVTRDNLAFLRLCLESVLAATERPFELIVVDNGSSDGTPTYLTLLAERNPHVRPICNDSNRGFAAACNQGADVAAGEVLVLLNDDTAVSPGWLERLSAHLERPEVGMVGPTTNRTGNEAQIDADYRTWAELVRFADTRASEHAGEAFEIPTLTMFCVAMRRELYEQVGPLDERFETGLLEDDDYSRRVRDAGYRLLCADDAFVHHFGETSFGKLVPSGEYARVLEANRARFEEQVGGTMAALRAPPQRSVQGAERAGAAGGGRRRPCRRHRARRQPRRRRAAAGGRSPGVAFPARRRRRLCRPPPGGQRRGDRPARGAARGGRRVHRLPGHRQRGGWSTTRGFDGTSTAATPDLLRSRDRRDLRPSARTRSERADDRLRPGHAPQRNLAGGAGAATCSGSISAPRST